RDVAIAGFALWLAGALLAPAPRDGDAPPWHWATLAPLLLALVVALTWLLDPYVRVFTDAWVHAGIAWDIALRGIPPQDPRFAGLPLNYVWYFNLFLALAHALGARDVFVTMELVNTVSLAVCAALTARLAWSVWGDVRATAGAVLLLPVGLNAFAWLLWPMQLGRAVLGRDRGWAQVLHIARDVRFGHIEILYSLSAPLAFMTSFIDKFTVGTALNSAWVMMLLVLLALVRGAQRPRLRPLAWAALGAAGMLFFHGVVGLSVLPVTFAALALALLLRTHWPWLPGWRALVPLGIALAVGALIALPYTRAISAAWESKSTGVTHHYLRPGVAMVWTLVTALGFVAWLARAPLRRAFAERRPGGALLALWTLAMTGFALVVHLPLDNESKFVFQLLFALVVFAGVAFLPWLGRIAARFGRRGAALAVLLLLVPFALTWHGYVADPSAATHPALHPTAAEAALDQWIRTRTPVDAVFVECCGMDRVMALGRRRLLAGTTAGPDKAAFPAGELARRRELEDDLFGAAVGLDQDRAALDSLRAPVYVLYRASLSPDRPWRALERDPHFRRAYDGDTLRVYELRR
ncbi:MAG TPA: hypothetical protein VFK69_02530, partial [Candidatus Eisenbacteria bacterium]|nr:hypothetical protein [Candidatus Eisenbacteria bacterium]